MQPAALQNLLEDVHTVERVHEMNVPGKSNPHRHINERSGSDAYAERRTMSKHLGIL